MTASNGNPSGLVVFDHDHGHLQTTSQAAGFQLVEVGYNEKEQQDAVAAKWLIENQGSWEIAFLHIDDPEWKKLVEETPKGNILVRFSSQGFRSRQIEKADPLCIRCLRKTTELKATEETNDILILLGSLRNPSDLEVLRDGKRTPLPLAGLVAFKEPHRLRAMRILLEAVLTAFAMGDNDPEKRSIAAGALNLPVPEELAPPLGFTNIGSIRRQLGITGDHAAVKAGIESLRQELASELDRDNLHGDGGIGDSLAALLNDLVSSSGDQKVDAEKVADCYALFGQHLRIQ